MARPANRSLGLLAFTLPLAEFQPEGERMIQECDNGTRLARNLVDLLAPYEEELIQLERELPAFGPLRRALGIVIAEASYCISDASSAQNDLVHPSGDETRRT